MTLWVLEWIGVLYGALLGGGLASFGCVVSERVPAGQSIGGRSHCVCGRQLRAWQNIPLAGWLMTGGRARCCGSSIPVRYVLCEAAYAVVGGVTVGAVWHSFTTGSVSMPLVVGALAAFLGCFPVLLACTWQRDAKHSPAS